MSVILETTLGDITVDLHIVERPRASLNFLKLCKIKYYNYSLFHKIEHNFTAQTGDPDGTGRGGESVFCSLYGEQAKYFEAEIKPRLKHQEFGTVSMINNGQNMHGSQFFVTLGEDLDYLDGEHTVFGQVVEGLEVLQKINDAICDKDHHPYQDIRISHTVVLDDPFDDPPGLKIPDGSPELTEQQLKSSGRIGADEEIDDTKGKSLEEIEEEIQDKEAKARATILEMVGDIPEVDVKPPDNVLFVCKLNPVTTADDLEVIFARFGKIVSCEVIKEKKTGESLQYAFIEFDQPQDCENAYFKMDNVLIDDRRIHVDFSQSVSKLNYEELRKHAKQPKFQIKEKMSEKRHDQKYDMVFEEPNSSLSYKGLKDQLRNESKKTRNADKDYQTKSHKRPEKESSEKHKKESNSPRYSQKKPNQQKHPSSRSGSSSSSDGSAAENSKETNRTYKKRNISESSENSEDEKRKKLKKKDDSDKKQRSRSNERSKRRHSPSSLIKAESSERIRKRESPERYNRRNSPNTFRRRNATQTQRRFSPPAQKRRASPKMQSRNSPIQRRNFPETQRRRYSPETQRRKSSPETQRRRYSPEAQRKKNSPEEAQRRKNSPEAQRRKNSPEVQKRRNSSETQRKRYSPETQRRRYSPEARRRKNSSENSNSKMY